MSSDDIPFEQVRAEMLQKFNELDAYFPTPAIDLDAELDAELEIEKIRLELKLSS